jgi:hypothetical protein
MSLLLPLLFLVALSTAGVSNQSSQDIVGTWEFVSGKQTNADGTTVELTASDLRSVKILNETYFSVTTRNADGSFRHTNLGPYRIQGDLYTETLEYSTNPEWMGGTEVYKSRVEGDLWHIDNVGHTYPKWGEVWRRVKGSRDEVEF